MEEQIGSGKYTLPKFAQDLPVLLVDRNKSLNKIKAKLEKFSYQVTGVNLASEALSMIWESKTCYKFVVADRNLPEMDYVSFVHTLRQREIPLIWLSDSYDGAKQALLDGASYFLIKPISSNDLKRLWQFALRRSNQKESHGAGGASGSAAGLDLPDTENKQVVKKEQVNQRDKEEGLTTTTNNQQEGSKHKRLSDDQQGSMQDKRTKYNKSESILEPQERDQNERGWRGDGNRNAKGRERPLWGPQLERKFQAAISELGLGATARAIYEKMNDQSINIKQVRSHHQKFKSSCQNQDLNTNFAASSSSTFKNQLPAEVAAATKLLGSEQARNWVKLGDGIQNPKPMVELGPAGAATTEPPGFEQANIITSSSQQNFLKDDGMQNDERRVEQDFTGTNGLVGSVQGEINSSSPENFRKDDGVQNDERRVEQNFTGTNELVGYVQGEKNSSSLENFLKDDGMQNDEPLDFATGLLNKPMWEWEYIL